MDLIAGTVQLTAAYTNALLMAILPHVSEFATKLELEIPTPVTTNAVARFGAFRHIGPDRSVPGRVVFSTGVGGQVQLTNGMIFEFDRGQITKFMFTAPYWPSGPRDAVLAREIRLTSQQAIEIARQKVRSLGYDLNVLHMNLPAQVRAPGKAHGRQYALYNIVWKKPNLWDRKTVEAWVNGETGSLSFLWLLGAPTRPPPELSVKPVIAPDPDAEHDLSTDEKKQLCERLLPEMEWLGKRLGLPLPQPMSSSAVRDITAYSVEGHVRAIFVLTNGCSFDTGGYSQICGGSAADAFFGWHSVKAKDFVGAWKVNRGDALKMARKTAQDLQRPDLIMIAAGKPKVNTPFLTGAQTIPRYLFEWSREIKGEEHFLTVEVDAEKRRVTAVNFSGSNTMSAAILR
jgi:hypothetical protein